MHMYTYMNPKMQIPAFKKKKIKGYLVLGTGEYRLFQVSLLFLFTFIFDRTAVYLSLFELDF